MTSGITLWFVKESRGLSSEKRRRLLHLVVTTRKDSHRFGTNTELTKGESGVEVENEKTSIRRHTESQYDSGNAGKDADWMGRRER